MIYLCISISVMSFEVVTAAGNRFFVTMYWYIVMPVIVK